MNTSIVGFHGNFVAISVIGFSVTFLACLFGLFSDNYKDNWPQHVGLAMVGIASFLKVHQTIERGFASGETAFLAIGTAVFALGVAWKVHGFARDEAIRKKYAKPPTLKKAHK